MGLNSNPRQQSNIQWGWFTTQVSTNILLVILGALIQFNPQKYLETFSILGFRGPGGRACKTKQQGGLQLASLAAEVVQSLLNIYSYYLYMSSHGDVLAMLYRYKIACRSPGLRIGHPSSMRPMPQFINPSESLNRFSVL